MRVGGQGPEAGTEHAGEKGWKTASDRELREKWEELGGRGVLEGGMYDLEAFT